MVVVLGFTGGGAGGATGTAAGLGSAFPAIFGAGGAATGFSAGVASSSSAASTVGGCGVVTPLPPDDAGIVGREGSAGHGSRGSPDPIRSRRGTKAGR